MPAQFATILTTLGAARIAAAIASSSTVNIQQIAVGDGNGLETNPTAATTALVRETYRANINNSWIHPANPNYISFELVIPAATGGWTVREAGLFDDEGTLIAVCKYPPTYKPVAEEGAVGDLVIRFVLAVEQPEAMQVVIDPNIILATRTWVEDNYSLANLMPGGTTGMVLRKASNAPGHVEWYDPTTGLNLIVQVVHEEQELSAAQDVVVLATLTTNGMAVYIDGVRLHPSMYEIQDETGFILDTPATGGEKILIVQNEPHNSGNFLRSANNLSEIAAGGPGAQLQARTNMGVPEIGELQMLMLDMIYPVGAILITCKEGNPADWTGGPWSIGTWVRHAEGQFLAGYHAGQTEFNTLHKTGGQKNTTLGLTNLPAHAHGIAAHNGTAAAAGAHKHTVMRDSGPTGSHGHSSTGTDLAGNPTNTNLATPVDTSIDGSHTHNVNIPALTTEMTPPVAASAVPFSNLPPFTTVFMWRRTA